MTANHFSGPLAGDFADFLTTLEASATANKSTLTQLRALDRLTRRSPLPLGTIDEALARAWLVPCATRGPNTRRSRYYLLRRFCRFLAKRHPGTFVPGDRLRPRGRPPKPPHIYSKQEVRLLLEGALSLRSAAPHTRRCGPGRWCALDPPIEVSQIAPRATLTRDAGRVAPVPPDPRRGSPR